jgi:hypothetical protein
MSPTGARGGNGWIWPYTGSYYAGGGGGDLIPSAPLCGAGRGGLGGGGGRCNGSTGGVNTGGGGGGSGGWGGSGIVALTVPNAFAPTISGGTKSNPPSAPGMTVVTFNSSGTFTA